MAAKKGGKEIPEGIKDNKIQKVWDNPKHTVIDKESYKAYNKIFHDELLENTSIKADFEVFKDTGWFERYMLNTAQFSAAKDLSETKALQSLAIESKSFKEFKDEANNITDVFNNQWLRVEQDLCKRNAIQGEVWRNMERDKDLYPYWEYKTENDDRVRDEHAALEGLIFKIGDPEGDSVHPENGWNCRCHSEPVDDQYIKEENKEVSKGSDYLNEKDPETGNSYIDKNFRYNPGIQGPLPNDSSYSEVLSSANKGNAELFPEIDKNGITEKEWEQCKNSKYGDEMNPYYKDNNNNLIRNYTDYLYQPLNEDLMSNNVSTDTRLVENALNKALDSKDNFSGNVYRGMSLNEEDSIKFLNKIKDEGSFQFKGFTSTSMDRNKAGEFLGNGKTFIEIESKTGKDISKWSSEQAEKEVLFKSNTKFEYVESKNITKDGNLQYIHIKLKEI